MSSAVPPRWVPWAVAALAVAAYAATPAFGFVYDDHRFVAGNASLDQVSILWRAFADPAAQTADGTHAGLWRPLRTLSFALDRLLFGDAAWGPHAVNVLVHGAASGLLTRLLLRFGAGSVGAALGGLVVALHPTQVEAVAWVSSRGDLLAAALVWGALLAAPRRSAWALGGLALLAKEQAVVWPALALAAALLEGERLGVAWRRARGPLVVTLVFVAVRHVVLTEPFQQGGLTAGTPRVGEMLAMLAHQTARALLPVGGTFDWQLPWPPPAGARRLALVTLGLLPCVGLFVRRLRAPLIWFLAALGPTLFVQWLVPLNIRTADRFLVFALPALGVIVARGVTCAPKTVPAVGLAILALATLTSDALPHWRSESALWSHTVTAQRRHWRARAWLGADALARGDPEAAVEHLRVAADAAPLDAKTHFLLGQACQSLAPRTAAEDSERVMDLTLRARAAYAHAVGLYTAEPAVARQEGEGGLLPIARIRAVDLTLALGDRASAARLLRGLLDSPAPVLPDRFRETWFADVDLLAEHVERYGVGTDDETAELADRLRAWGTER